MSTRDLKVVERRLFEEWNKGKAAAIAATEESHATNCVFHLANGQDIRGLKNLEKHVSDYNDVFPDAHFTIDDIIAEGDKVAIRYTFTGTHKGEGIGFPPTNKKVIIQGISISHRDPSGKIIEEWEKYDTMDAMRQLGILPTPKKTK